MVHPHGRGEKRTRSGLSCSAGGSPPRAWGKGARGEGDANIAGFTPTGVGKSDPAVLHRVKEPVHPHGRGEKHAISIHVDSDPGSPPRAWGKVRADPVRPNSSRFTPTGVGKRHAPCYASAMPQVHPHGRGEKLAVWSTRGEPLGSPPRAWGKVGMLPSGHRW